MVWGLIIACIALGWALGGLWANLKHYRALGEAERKRREHREANAGWNRLPSGWSRDYTAEITGFVSIHGDTAVWWVARRGKTAVEGRADTAVLAQQEVESAVEWLRS